jgi:transcriptional regulator with XRE-family HTH domain
MDKKARLILAKRVKEVREKRGMTQEKLASSTGIDYKYIQRIEGKNPPAVRIDTIEKIAQALKTTCADLLKK